jgi:ADP-heptose:LPS heptosyltransferase
MASVVARALHERYAQVDALTVASHRQALARVPDVDGLLIDEGDEAELVLELQQRGYAACIVTWATARAARVAQMAKIPIRVGQTRRLYSWRFTHRVPVRSEFGDVISHWSQIMLDYARALECDTADSTPHFVPADEDRMEAQALLREWDLSKNGYVILHPTNAIAPARGIWPARGWGALADALHREFALPVLLTGSKADASINTAILANAREPAVIDVAGKSSIGGFGALAQNAALFTGITTGAMHVAAAVGTPTVGIFPFQTDTPERWAPLGAHTSIVRASYPCRPGERKENCPDYACIANLDVPRIIAACRLLTRSVGV